MRTGPGLEHLVGERERFASRMAASRRAYDRVEPLIPGGVPGGLSCWPTYTHVTYMDRAEGC